MTRRVWSERGPFGKAIQLHGHLCSPCKTKQPLADAQAG